MAKGFWKALFSPSPSVGATVDDDRAWELSRPPRPLRLAPAFKVLFSANAIIALEGGSIDPQVVTRLQPHSVVPSLVIRPGTVYPVSQWFHFRADGEALRILEDLTQHFADVEICNHLYGYEGTTLLLEWHDAFRGVIRVADSVPPTQVDEFCAALGVPPARRPARWRH